ncbi:MAG: ubiquinol-cytochrome c reductase iron-sulfur subunit [Helicobacteraceae bacterium]
MADCKRRAFIKGAGVALGATATVGGGFVLYGMKRAWDPLPSVIAAGITEVETANMQPGDTGQVEFRGKPVFIMRKTELMPPNDNRDVIINGNRFTVIILICTHLGCIPAWTGEGFKCACHGGEFDTSGVNTFGPPPIPMVIPEFKIEGTKLVLGKTSPEYEALMKRKA